MKTHYIFFIFLLAWIGNTLLFWLLRKFWLWLRSPMPKRDLMKEAYKGAKNVTRVDYNVLTGRFQERLVEEKGP